MNPLLNLPNFSTIGLVGSSIMLVAHGMRFIDLFTQHFGLLILAFLWEEYIMRIASSQ
jgi:hypothetical protein